MHSDWFNRIEILQGRWQHREKVGYCYPCGLEKTLCKWDIYVPLVTKGLTMWLPRPELGNCVTDRKTVTGNIFIFQTLTFKH